MLKLLLGERPGHSIWTVELERAGASYTIDTVRSLRSQLAPEAQLYLILGSDNLAGFPRWLEAEQLLAWTRPIVLPRRGSPRDPADLASLSPAARARLGDGWVTMDPIDISSTKLPGLLAEGGAPPAVMSTGLWDYLMASGLYRS